MFGLKLSWPELDVVREFCAEYGIDITPEMQWELAQRVSEERCHWQERAKNLEAALNRQEKRLRELEAELSELSAGKRPPTEPQMQLLADWVKDYERWLLRWRDVHALEQRLEQQSKELTRPDAQGVSR